MPHAVGGEVGDAARRPPVSELGAGHTHPRTLGAAIPVRDDSWGRLLLAQLARTPLVAISDCSGSARLNGARDQEQTDPCSTQPLGDARE